MRYFALLAAVLILYGCEDVKSLYVITDNGLTVHWRASCISGMLVSSEGINVLDIHSTPITCSGYIKLTKDERDEYLNGR